MKSKIKKKKNSVCEDILSKELLPQLATPGWERSTRTIDYRMYRSCRLYPSDSNSHDENINRAEFPDRETIIQYFGHCRVSSRRCGTEKSHSWRIPNKEMFEQADHMRKLILSSESPRCSLATLVSFIQVQNIACQELAVLLIVGYFGYARLCWES